jgi:hypothetical protein
MEPVVRLLLDHVRGSLRVVVLPTACASDGKRAAERAAEMGVAHFTRLGVYVEPAMVLTRADAASPDLAAQIAAATFVYLADGKPAYLRDSLRGSRCWEAIAGVYARGGVVAGCAAGTTALCDRMLAGRRFWRTLPGLGLAHDLAPDLAVLPGPSALPPWLTNLAIRAQRRLRTAAVDPATALIATGGEWLVAGHGGVTIYERGRPTRYTGGQPVALAPSGVAVR